MSTQGKQRVAQLMAAARTQPPVRYDVERGLARHKQLQLSAAVLPEWAARPNGAWRGWVGKLGLGAMLVGGITVALMRLQSPATSPLRAIPAPVQEPVLASPPPPAAGPQVLLESVIAPQVAVSAPQTHAKAASSQRAAAVRRPHSPGERQAPERPASLAAAPADSSEVASVAASGSLGSAPDVQHIELRPFEREKAAPDEEELRWLSRAEAALHDEPARALSLVREGDARFARGYFAQERAYLAVMATHALGQRDAARALARKFLANHPRSPYAERVRACAAE